MIQHERAVKFDFHTVEDDAAAADGQILVEMVVNLCPCLRLWQQI